MKNEEYYYNDNGNVIEKNYQKCVCGNPHQYNLRNNNYANNQNVYALKLKICIGCGELYEVQETNVLKRKNPEVNEELIEKDGKTQLVVKNFVKLDDEPAEDLLDYTYNEGGVENVNYITFKKNQILASENKLLDDESNIIELPYGI